MYIPECKKNTWESEQAEAGPHCPKSDQNA